MLPPEIASLLELYLDSVHDMQQFSFLGLVDNSPLSAYKALKSQNNGFQQIQSLRKLWNYDAPYPDEAAVAREKTLVTQQINLHKKIPLSLYQQKSYRVIAASLSRIVFNKLPERVKPSAQPMLDASLGSLIGVQQEIAYRRYQTGSYATPYESLIREYNPHLTEEKTNDYCSIITDLMDDVMDRPAHKIVTSDTDFREKLSFGQKMQMLQDMQEWFGIPAGYLEIYPASAPAVIGSSHAAFMSHDFKHPDLAIFLGDSVHEIGHVNYKLHLPKNLRRTASGQILGTGHDEAQAYILENHILEDDATREFICDYLVKGYGLSPAKWNPQNLDRYDRTFNFQTRRLESCDLSNLVHIAVLTGIERDLINSGASGKTYGARWKQAMQHYNPAAAQSFDYSLNLYPFAGLFGNYPSYFEGAAGAAQLYEAGLAQNPQWTGQWRQGNFRETAGWLAEHAQKPASTKPIDQLYQDATGSPLTTEAFLTKYRAKYGLNT